ncbi:MAG TPA: hypothetical protein VD770_04335, partial [Coxiellaceae bacterium]|nr:hypothetical protein [Coxiellaceae bacterium]
YSPFPRPSMKLTDKSPLWKWREIVEWLYLHQLIHEKEWIEEALFLENINLALELRHTNKYKIQKDLLAKLK